MASPPSRAPATARPFGPMQDWRTPSTGWPRRLSGSFECSRAGSRRARLSRRASLSPGSRSRTWTSGSPSSPACPAVRSSISVRSGAPRAGLPRRIPRQSSGRRSRRRSGGIPRATSPQWSRATCDWPGRAARSTHCRSRRRGRWVPSRSCSLATSPRAKGRRAPSPAYRSSGAGSPRWRTFLNWRAACRPARPGPSQASMTPMASGSQRRAGGGVSRAMRKRCSRAAPTACRC